AGGCDTWLSGAAILHGTVVACTSPDGPSGATSSGSPARSRSGTTRARPDPVAAGIRIVFGGETIADTTGAYRVLEMSHPPRYQLPPSDITEGVLARTHRGSWCGWKGEVRFFDASAGGWITPDFTGLFKGKPGTSGW
ncbi:MAG TPA: DUF427 domain-containing protein, partial [Acidimicrobiales bacterium]